MRDYDYSTLAQYYDVLESNSSIAQLNGILHSRFKKNKIRTILDLSCGTGFQSAFLREKGYRVTASDLNRDMVKVAQKKFPRMKFHVDDMRTAQFGTFDAVITIYNAIGHLSKPDFETAVRNIASNLRRGGLYIFDIFNLDCMKRNFTRQEFIDTATEVNEMKFARFNRNTLDVKNGMIHLNQRTYIQKGFDKPRVILEKWDYQIYTADQLRKILTRNGFEIVSIEDIRGIPFSRSKSLSILVTARKR